MRKRIPVKLLSKNGQPEVTLHLLRPGVPELLREGNRGLAPLPRPAAPRRASLRRRAWRTYPRLGPLGMNQGSSKPTMLQNTLITIRGTVRPLYAMVAAGAASPGPTAALRSHPEVSTPRRVTSAGEDPPSAPPRDRAPTPPLRRPRDRAPPSPGGSRNHCCFEERHSLEPQR